MGTLNCRKRRGRRLYSEHSFGTAIDISHIDGASVKRDWGKSNSNGLTLAKATSLREYFNSFNTGPNKLHHDHYHLDTDWA